MRIAWFYDRLTGQGYKLAEVLVEKWPLELRITVQIQWPNGAVAEVELDRFLLVWLN